MDADGAGSQERTAPNEVSAHSEPGATAEAEEAAEEPAAPSEIANVAEQITPAPIAHIDSSEPQAQAGVSHAANGHSVPTETAEAKASNSSAVTTPAYTGIQVQPSESNGVSGLSCWCCVWQENA